MNQSNETTPINKCHKSANQIISSLRIAYESLRERKDKKSKLIIGLQGKARNLSESRDNWKARAKEAEARLEKLEAQLQNQEKKRKV